MGKLAQRAGRFAPAVAVLGALAAVPYGAVAAGHDAPAPRRAPASLSSAHLQGFLTRNALLDAYRRNPLPVAHATSAAPHREAARRAAPKRKKAVSQAPASPASAAAPAAACSGSASGMVPANYATIVSFLMAHGYTGNAAAGIAGNIYQESGGNPESIGSGGGGLIGWTPLPAGYVTGDPAADLQTQLTAILSFNQIWAQYIPALNAAASPAQAADIYVTDFERAGIPAASNREAAATAVAAACGI